MDFYLVDVLSTITINGNDIAFDYINTYLDLDKAIEAAKEISENPDVLRVTVHHWVVNPDGSQDTRRKQRQNGYSILIRQRNEVKE